MQGHSNAAEPLYELPASTAQEAINLRADVTPAAWNVAVRFCLRGDLNPAHLETAINRVVAQHEILRTAFATSNGALAQRIMGSVFVPLARFDLSRNAINHDAELDRISKAEARRTFDLAQAPLLRAGLIKLSSEEHVLLLTLHHAICD